MIHLDTSFLIDLLTPRGRAGRGAGDQRFVACELAAGAALSKRPAQERRRVDQLCAGVHVEYPDERFSAVYGSLLAALERGAGRISTMDLLSATAAVVAGASLVTRNARDFSRVPGLEVLGY